jgi:hypothetical protein
VPLLSVHEEVRNGTLRVVHLSDHAIRRPLAVIHRKAKALSRPQRAFVEMLTQEGAGMLEPHLKREPAAFS